MYCVSVKMTKQVLFCLNMKINDNTFVLNMCIITFMTKEDCLCLDENDVFF